MFIENALWSGYQLTQDDFRALVESIPAANHELVTYGKPKRRRPLESYIMAYRRWRNSLPSELRMRVPRMMCEYQHLLILGETT